MLRYIPTALTTHSVLNAKQKAYFHNLDKDELGKYEMQDVGRLLEAIIYEQVPDWRSYYPAAPWLPAGRALSTNLLREECGFTADECARGRATIEACANPATLLASFFALRKTSRIRLLARAWERHGVTTANQLNAA